VHPNLANGVAVQRPGEARSACNGWLASDPGLRLPKSPPWLDSRRPRIQRNLKVEAQFGAQIEKISRKPIPLTKAALRKAPGEIEHRVMNAVTGSQLRELRSVTCEEGHGIFDLNRHAIAIRFAHCANECGFILLVLVPAVACSTARHGLSEFDECVAH
jgi:hypothetical protein